MTLILQEAPSIIHLVKEVEVKKGLRFAKVKCGASLAPDDPRARPIEWVSADSLVTCPDCKWSPNG